MAEREDQKNVKQEKEEEESSASEYEEIIEEVTDYSDEEEEEEQKVPPPKKEGPKKEVAKKEVTKKEVAAKQEVTKQTAVQKVEKLSQVTESVSKKLAKVELASSSNSSSTTDGGVVQVQAAQQKSSSTSEQRTETKSKDGGATVTTTTTKVTTRTVSGSAASKNISPLAKFKQLDKQAAAQQAQKSSPTTTSTPTTPGGSAQPLFKFTDPALNARAATVKDQLLQWCQHKTQEYENVQISNFSSSWSDGLAFCALIHHFLPDAFDYTQLTKETRRHNFELAFSVADEKAGIAPLLDVEDMVEMSRPDWKCVFVYVQSIYRRFRNCQ